MELIIVSPTSFEEAWYHTVLAIASPLYLNIVRVSESIIRPGSIRTQ